MDAFSIFRYKALMLMKIWSLSLVLFCAFIFAPFQMTHAHGDLEANSMSCEMDLRNQNGGSISMWSKPQTSIGIGTPQTSMVDLEKSLGFTPDLKYDVYSSEEALVLHYPKTAVSFGRLMYTITGSQLEINLMVIAPLLKKKGVGSYLVQEMTAMNPQVTRVEATLFQDNLHVFHRNFMKFQQIGLRSREKACLDAMRETPFYRTFQAAGFSEVLECRPGRFKAGTLDYTDYPQVLLGRKQ